MCVWEAELNLEAVRYWKDWSINCNEISCILVWVARFPKGSALLMHVGFMALVQPPQDINI